MVSAYDCVMPHGEYKHMNVTAPFQLTTVSRNTTKQYVLSIILKCLVVHGRLLYPFMDQEETLGFTYHGIYNYQSPLILTELFQHNLINVSYLTACYLYRVMRRCTF